MRVGLFSNAYRPFISGVVNSVDYIRKGLMREGHTAFIFAPEYKNYSDEHAGVFRFRSVEMSRKVQWPIPIPFSTKIFPKIARLELDIIHTHHPLLLGDVGAHFSRKLKVPLVYTFHTQLEHYAHYIPLNQGMVQKLVRSTVVAYTQKCDLIICPSPTIRQLLEEYKIETRVEILQNAIDLAPFQEADGTTTRAGLGFKPEHQVAVYAGRLGQEKNLDFLLDCFAEVCQQNPQARLLIIGEGTEKERLQERSRELFGPGIVVFTGPVEYGQIPNYFAAGDLFVMTSTTEVKPLVVLEAMATRLPVVAVAACGTQDTLTHGHDGWLTDTTRESFVGGLQNALNDGQERRRRGENAADSVTEYSLENYTKRLLTLYRELSVECRREGRSKTAMV